MYKLFTYKLLSIFILLLHVDSFAIEINENSSQLQLLSHSSIYIDTNNSLSKQDVMKKKFTKINQDILGFGFVPNTAVWIKFTLTNNSNTTINKIIEYDNPETEDILFFDLNLSTLDGMFHITPFRKSIHPSFVVKLDAYEERTYYIKAHCKISTLIVKLTLWDKEAFLHHDYKHKTYLFIFFAVIVTLLLYNFMLLIFTKDKAYLYYVLYLSGVVFFQSIYLGVAQLYFFSNEVSIFLTKATTFYISLLVFPIILFTRQFLKTEQFKKIDAILKFYLYLMPLLVIISFDNFLVTLDIIVLFVPLGLVMVFTGFYALYKGIKEALFYVIGWSFLILSLVLSVLRSLGVFDITSYFLYVNEVAFMLESLLFSIALAHRINILSKEKALADKKLIALQQHEQKQLNILVEEKTEDLHSAFEEKNILYKELNHRVKNNLQMILSLINLQISKTPSNETKNELSITRNRVRSISYLYERLYMQENATLVDTKEYFENIAQSIAVTSSKKIRVLYDIHYTLDANIIMYCGLILNELLTNVYKYAYKEEGKVIVSLFEKESTIFFNVEDFGAGFIQHPTNSLGLIIVDSLVHKQLSGAMYINSQEGTKVKMQWSKHE